MPDITNTTQNIINISGIDLAPGETVNIPDELVSPAVRLIIEGGALKQTPKSRAKPKSSKGAA